MVGVRANGRQTVNVDGMSDGTCDQLYLALRLALLESYLTDHDPLPLIVDDILIMCDDNRAVAALRFWPSSPRKRKSSSSRTTNI